MFSISKILVVLAVVLSVLVATTAGFATTFLSWDLSADFSATSNPNGQWKFLAYAGDSPDATYNDNTVNWPIPIGDPGSLKMWQHSSLPGVPIIFKNAGLTAMVTDPGGQTVLDPGQVGLHPYYGTQGDKPSAVRWTAPSNGEYAVNAVFSGRHISGVTTDVKVVKNGGGGAIWSEQVDGWSGGSYWFSTPAAFGSAPVQTYSDTLTLVAGDYLDFVVAAGTSQSADSTGLSITIISDIVVAAPTWDLSADYSATSNPNGPWLFLLYAGSAPNASYTTNTAIWPIIVGDPGSLQMWYHWSLASLPVIFKNAGTTAMATDPGGETILDPGQVGLHPAYGGNGYLPSAVRWTAPAADDYVVNAEFSGRNIAGATTDVQIIKSGGGGAIWSGQVDGWSGGSYGFYTPDRFGSAPEQTYSGILTLAAGQYLDFVVGAGVSQYANSTGLSVTIDVAGAVLPPQFSPVGGSYTTPVTVTISCATADATIRYTTDGGAPTPSSTLYTQPFLVDRETTVKAKAWVGPDASVASAATYRIGTSRNDPQVILYSDSIVIDGILSDWAGAEWVDADKHYYATGDWSGNDMSNAKFAMKWGAGGNKVYLAVKVTDAQHVFTPDYGSWNDSDRIEVQLHTTGTGTYDPTEEAAQQYTVGIASTGPPATFWKALASTAAAVPSSAGFSCAGAVNGNELIYELALTPFDYFGGLVSQPNVPTTLVAGDVIGFDLVVDSRTNAGEFFMLSENTLTSKYDTIASIGQHLLVVISTIDNVKKLDDGATAACMGTVSAVFSDCFYIENTDRPSGIRVGMPNHGRTVGQEVTVSGMLWTMTSGERYILAKSVVATGGTGTVLPLGMNNKSFGGGDADGQAGIADGAGLNNIGLLVKVWGRTTDLGGGRYSIEDGSGASLIAQVAQGTITDGAYVAATGIVSCEKDGGGAIRRLLLVQDAATDVTSY